MRVGDLKNADQRGIPFSNQRFGERDVWAVFKDGVNVVGDDLRRMRERSVRSGRGQRKVRNGREENFAERVFLYLCTKI